MALNHSLKKFSLHSAILLVALKVFSSKILISLIIFQVKLIKHLRNLLNKVEDLMEMFLKNL